MAGKAKKGKSSAANSKSRAGSEIKLPADVHAVDAYGNVFASLPELHRVCPSYFTVDELRAAIKEGKVTSLSEEDLGNLQTISDRK